MASGGDMEEVVVAMSKASMEVVEEAGKKKKIDRHCGFCLTLVPGEEVKVCGGCRRRAYCSKECQKADWTQATVDTPAFNGTIYGYGQGHKNWCGLPYGEEDLDWKVVPISGKGLGIVALRDLPYLYRIIVEGAQQPPEPLRIEASGDYSTIYLNEINDRLRALGITSPAPAPFHPEMSDLLPANTSNISTKFLQNGVTSGTGMRLGLRLSRINHSCKPNASYSDEANLDFASLVLCADREIKAGEEICRSYVQGLNFPFFFKPTANLSYKIDLTYQTAEECREEYEKRWGILNPCSSTCFCRDEKTDKVIDESQELGEYCVKNPLKKPALQKFQKVMENAKAFGVGPMHLSSFYLFASRLAMTRRETLEEAKKYMKLAFEIMEAVLHPTTFSKMKNNKSMPTNVLKYPEYLAAEDDDN